jgi:glycosyltransferase involved in cell wall biosynthesis
MNRTGKARSDPANCAARAQDRSPGPASYSEDVPPRARLPRVSVVTVVLNAAEVIERTLVSVIGQDYPDLEYIVVDGLSCDGTLAVIRKYSAWIAKCVSEKDGGIYEAMNKGAALATGEWILFMNAGDLFVERNVITRTFRSCNWAKCDVIYGDGIFSDEKYRLRERAPDRVTLTDGSGFSHQSTFVRAAVQRQYGFDPSERIAADYDFFLRLYKAKKAFQRVDVLVSEFFIGGFSTRPPMETIRLRHRIYKKHFPRSDLILYFRLACRAMKIVGRAIVPANAWEAAKRLRMRRKLLPDPAGGLTAASRNLQADRRDTA